MVNFGNFWNKVKGAAGAAATKGIAKITLPDADTMTDDICIKFLGLANPRDPANAGLVDPILRKLQEIKNIFDNSKNLGMNEAINQINAAMNNLAGIDPRATGPIRIYGLNAVRILNLRSQVSLGSAGQAVSNIWQNRAKMYSDGKTIIKIIVFFVLITGLGGIVSSVKGMDPLGAIDGIIQIPMRLSAWFNSLIGGILGIALVIGLFVRASPKTWLLSGVAGLISGLILFYLMGPFAGWLGYVIGWLVFFYAIEKAYSFVRNLWAYKFARGAVRTTGGILGKLFGRRGRGGRPPGMPAGGAAGAPVAGGGAARGGAAPPAGGAGGPGFVKKTMGKLKPEISIFSWIIGGIVLAIEYIFMITYVSSAAPNATTPLFIIGIPLVISLLFLMAGFMKKG